MTSLILWGNMVAKISESKYVVFDTDAEITREACSKETEAVTEYFLPEVSPAGVFPVFYF